MPAYQIQKELILSLGTLPIKTDHLIASGIGKVLVFYQRSKRIEPNLKRIVDQLIGDWTRPILNKSDSYKDRTIQLMSITKRDFPTSCCLNELLSQRRRNRCMSKVLKDVVERQFQPPEPLPTKLPQELMLVCWGANNSEVVLEVQWEMKDSRVSIWNWHQWGLRRSPLRRVDHL